MEMERDNAVLVEIDDCMITVMRNGMQTDYKIDADCIEIIMDDNSVLHWDKEVRRWRALPVLTKRKRSSTMFDDRLFEVD